MNKKPGYWPNSLKEIENVVNKIKRGSSSVLTNSAGGRPVYLVEYGDRQDLQRKANYSSACGARKPEQYARKGPDIDPIILIVGNTHGGELEGTAGILNLIHIIETGCDLKGREWQYISKNYARFRLLLIPCHNPDGRARLPLDSLLGLTPEELRYYKLGTWRDGTLCKWPECKAVHPVIDDLQYMGAYFNDDGINMMHDNFFASMAPETKSLLGLADREAPDITLLLHGGANCVNHFSPTSYVPAYIKERITEISKRVGGRHQQEGIPFDHRDINGIDGESRPPPSFNLTSAIHHVCGGISILFESNEGLNGKGPSYSAGHIIDSHLLLFEEVFKYMREEKKWSKP